MTKQELLQSIGRSWNGLTKALEQLTTEQLTAVKDHQGWSVQDHIAHLTVWEQSVQGVLQGQERHQALGVDEAAYLARDFDKMNEQIYQEQKNQPLNSVIDHFFAVHSDFVTQIEALTETELSRPFRHYLPQDTRDDDDRPLIDLIYGNTAGHYDDHLEWIEALVNP